MQKVKWFELLSEKTEDLQRQWIQHLKTSKFYTNYQTKAHVLQTGVDTEANDQSSSEVKKRSAHLLICLLLYHSSLLSFCLYYWSLFSMALPSLLLNKYLFKINDHFSFS